MLLQYYNINITYIITNKSQICIPRPVCVFVFQFQFGTVNINNIIKYFVMNFDFDFMLIDYFTFLRLLPG